MDLTLSPEVEALRGRYRRFVESHIMPLEALPDTFDDHENIRLDLLETLREKAKAENLWAPQMPAQRGGLGLAVSAWAPCYEEMGRSIFGPLVFNCAAPDDGNMFLLNKIAREDQKQRWLQPLIDGKLRSSFAMTEPAPGAGSDPSLMLTRAVRNCESTTSSRSSVPEFSKRKSSWATRSRPSGMR